MIRRTGRTSYIDIEEMDESYPDYQRVWQAFHESSSTKTFNLEILKINKVFNPELKRKYMERRTAYINTYGNVKTMNLFHGTKISNITSILNNNLEVERHGENKGNRYGAGVSFSVFAHYASHYCDESRTEKVMLLCLVLVSNGVVVPALKKEHQTYTRPPLIQGQGNLRFDTTLKDIHGSVVVKFENHTYYPRYVIHFKKNLKMSPWTRVTSDYSGTTRHLDCMYSESNESQVTLRSLLRSESHRYEEDQHETRRTDQVTRHRAPPFRKIKSRMPTEDYTWYNPEPRRHQGSSFWEWSRTVICVSVAVIFISKCVKIYNDF